MVNSRIEPMRSSAAMKICFRKTIRYSVLALVAFSTAPAASPPPPALPDTLDSEEWVFLNLINDYRAQHGVGPLRVSAALQNSSRWMSTDMATKNYAGHTDSLGRDPHTRMVAFHYPYSPWGENIAGGFPDAQNALHDWDEACDANAAGRCTYGHRNNMLNPNFKVIGIGRAYKAGSAYGGWYWTTDFGGAVDQTINPAAGQ
jgi:uncharacterized protein YkwD